MMDCAQYRRAVLADPHDPDPELGAHRDSCPDCPGFTERLLRFEGRLELALRVNAPDARALRMRRGWMAMAASVLIVLAVAGGLWLAPKPSLAAAVVAHMAGEPQAWAATDIPVPPPELADVLRDSHMRLSSAAGIVTYARTCVIRGHQVPHLVVQTDQGPVTVMVLVHESSSKPGPFDQEGYRGVILPVAGHGSLAVLAQGQKIDGAAIEQIAARVQGAILWTD